MGLGLMQIHDFDAVVCEFVRVGHFVTEDNNMGRREDLHTALILSGGHNAVFDVLKDWVHHELHLVSGNVEKEDRLGFIKGIGQVSEFTGDLEQLHFLRILGEHVSLKIVLSFLTNKVIDELDGAVVGGFL